LREGPRRFRPGFTCPTLLGYQLGADWLRLRDFHPLRCRFPAGFGSPHHIPYRRPHDPGWCPTRFRLVPVRSPLLRESRLISFPPGTEMFQFPGSPWAFRAQRSLGSSPGHFAAFHAHFLMTPRHPPRALRSLTTPTRPRPALLAEPGTRPSRRTHLPTEEISPRVSRRTARSSVDSLQPARAGVNHRACGIRKGPRSWMVLTVAYALAFSLSLATTTQNLLRVSRLPDCQRAPTPR
jgi:hypothetical protein